MPDAVGGDNGREALFVKTWPVSEGAGHHHTVNIVEWKAKVPWFLKVVDLE